MSSKSPKGIHRVAGGSAPGMGEGVRPTLKGSNGTFFATEGTGFGDCTTLSGSADCRLTISGGVAPGY